MSASFPSSVVAAAKKDVVRRLRDRLAFALWLGIPLVIGGLMSLAFGGGDGKPPRAKLLVVDRDQSLVSKALFQALSSERAQVFDTEGVEEPAGRARIAAGDASALLVIPEAFGDALLREEPTRLELVTNPAQRILPSIVRETLEMLRELVFYAHRILGEELREIVAQSGEPTAAQVAALSVRIHDRVERVAGSLFPPVIELERVVREDDGAKPRASLGALFFPSMLLMALFFIAQGLSEDLWREKVLGVLRRAAVGPHGARAAFAGKVLAAWLLMLAIALVAGALGVFAFDVAPARALAASAWASLVGVLLALLMFALASLAKSQRAAGLVTNLALFPLLMIGGSFFPFELLPDWMGAIGRYTPNGFGIVVLKTLLDGSATAASFALALGLWLAAAAALYFVAARRVCGAFARNA